MIRYKIGLHTTENCMKKFILLTIFSLTLAHAQSQTHLAKLLGVCNMDELTQGQHAQWYLPNYHAYESNAAITTQLKKKRLADYTIKIFFGSWCGDSRREVPKMIKLLDGLSFDKNNITLIGLDDTLQFYKQSPGHEERGLNIYRVPTFIIYRDGNEIARIVETPAETFERDLLTILSGKAYTSSYYAYSFINEWLRDGLLKDNNISARGLAFKLRPFVLNESELNACGYVLLAQGNLQEAIAVFRINVNLFPQSANCYDSLGEAYTKSGNTEKAAEAYAAAKMLSPG